MILSDNELKSFHGGASIWAVLSVIAGLIFGTGVVDGYARPFKCN